MPPASSFDYAVVRVVPRVDRGEFVNAGVILFCRTRRFLSAQIELDRRRLLALSSQVDVEEVERHLAAIPLVCRGDPAAGEVGRLGLAERFHWLVAPRSSVVQVSPVHCGLHEEPMRALERLMDALVRPLSRDEPPQGAVGP